MKKNEIDALMNWGTSSETDDFEVLEQYFHAEQNEYDATRYLRLGFVASAENCANFESHIRQNESRYADDGNGNGQIYVEAGEGDAHRQCVDAGGYGEEQHGFEVQRGVGRLFLPRKGLAYHVYADEQKQGEGYPVVEGGDIVLEMVDEVVAHNGHQGLESTEPESHRQIGLQAGASQRKSFAHRHRESVHRKSYCQKQKRYEIHCLELGFGGAKVRKKSEITDVFPTVFMRC